MDNSKFLLSNSSFMSFFFKLDGHTWMKFVTFLSLSSNYCYLNTFQTESEIFPRNTGGGEKMCEELGVPYLGRLPLDPRLGQACDEGSDPLSHVPLLAPIVDSK